ncbi:TSP2-like protein [Mya arenaria]|uniref:TSP2-like protein n=1 Tax=Mya arenaria TaxID=6604 RepID=A0ABY7DBP5_MYAAR|nr:TSP2-like protein [Mya arenaria]
MYAPLIYSTNQTGLWRFGVSPISPSPVIPFTVRFIMKDTNLIRYISVTLLICLKIVLCSQTQNFAGCAIDSNAKVYQCTRDVLEIQRTRVMPFGVSCIVYDDNVEYNRSCYDNRNKGEFAVEGAFGPIGAAIGTAVGFVVDILCIFVCGKQDPPPENEPPYVKTPARLHSTGMIVADSGKTTATVSWTAPTFYDKEDGVELRYNTSPETFRSNGMYSEGSHTVFFSAKDSKGLPVQSSLGFKIKAVTCPPPDLEKDGRDIILYDCPNMYELGASCTLDCEGGYPLIGANTIRCVFDIHKKARWHWDSFKPFCNETNCNKLREPLNGSISCSAWTYGQMCTMQCQEGFDVPASIDGQFVCGTSTGKWRPSSYVPNCNVKTKAHHMNLPSEFYYYTDRCNKSDTNLLKIQENFVKALNSSKFPEFCRHNPYCQAKFVDVTCGPATSRRKRDIHPRSAANLAYIINFEFELPFNVPSGTSESDAFEDTEKLLYQMADVMQNAVDNEYDVKTPENADISLGVNTSSSDLTVTIWTMFRKNVPQEQQMQSTNAIARPVDDLNAKIRLEGSNVSVVNGNWSAWSGYTACSVTCGGGFMTRSRTCDSPKPDPEGKPCEGNSTQTEICNIDICQSLFFVDPPLPVYECGLATGYKWNHENKNNPTGRLQSCSELKRPSQTGAIFDGHYDTIPCNKENIERVKLEMTPKLSQMECVKSG